MLFETYISVPCANELYLCSTEIVTIQWLACIVFALFRLMLHSLACILIRVRPLACDSGLFRKYTSYIFTFQQHMTAKLFKIRNNEGQH
jgi:hypothetical protein